MRQKLRFFTIIVAAAFFAGSVLGAGNPEPAGCEAKAPGPGSKGYEAGNPELAGYGVRASEPGGYEAGKPDARGYTAKASVSGNEPGAGEGGLEGQQAEGGSLPGSVSSNDAEPGEDTPGGGIPGEDAPSEGFPEEDAPSEAFPEENAPSEAFPEEDAPSETFPEKDAPGEAIPGEDAPGGNVSGEAIPGVVSGTVFSVAVPESLDFVMDPYELAGQGSIWSQEYCFINKGSIPVKIHLGRLHCVAADSVVIVEGAEQAEGSGKRAALWLRMGNGDTVMITESNSAYEITLAPQEAFPFWISGKISVSDRWESGDISLSLWYRLEAP